MTDFGICKGVFMDPSILLTENIDLIIGLLLGTLVGWFFTKQLINPYRLLGTIVSVNQRFVVAIENISNLSEEQRAIVISRCLRGGLATIMSPDVLPDARAMIPDSITDQTSIANIESAIALYITSLVKIGHSYNIASHLAKFKELRK